jgi:hypothetical protein
MNGDNYKKAWHEVRSGSKEATLETDCTLKTEYDRGYVSNHHNKKMRIAANATLWNV